MDAPLFILYKTDLAVSVPASGLMETRTNPWFPQNIRVTNIKGFTTFIATCMAWKKRYVHSMLKCKKSNRPKSVLMFLNLKICVLLSCLAET